MMALADQNRLAASTGPPGVVDMPVVGVVSAHVADLDESAAAGPFGLYQVQRLFGRKGQWLFAQPVDAACDARLDDRVVSVVGGGHDGSVDIGVAQAVERIVKNPGSRCDSGGAFGKWWVAIRHGSNLCPRRQALKDRQVMQSHAAQPEEGQPYLSGDVRTRRRRGPSMRSRC